MRRIPHDSVYTDRLSERALCYDFPADKAFIDGLHAMQSYFVARGCNIDIPVVRVMNTAHWLVAYLYATSCSGEQLEYDAMTYNSVGRDKQLMYVSLIVLIAMLNRTEGARAKACRSMMLENRPEDFYEGVSLYEQWLDGGLEHYTDEDFLIDIMDEVNLLKQENERLTYENKQLKKQIEMDQEIKHIGYNVEHMTINMSGGTLVQHADLVQASGEVVMQNEPDGKIIEEEHSCPPENDYRALVRWLADEKKRGNDYYAEADYNRSKMCRNLLKIIGWWPNQDSLRKAQMRG